MATTAGSMPIDPFGFGGQWGYYLDRESGAYLCGHRYYDAGTGRWLSRDPIGQSGGANLYGYCGEDPVDLSDPSGLQWQKTIPRHRPKGFDVRKSMRVIDLKLDQLNFDYVNDWRMKMGLPSASSLAACDYCEDKLKWFYDMVVDGGPWDYKKRDKSYEDFGNWHYGYVSAAFGLSKYDAEQGGGLNRWWKEKHGGVKGEGTPFLQWPYGDQRSDCKLVDQGWDAFFEDVRSGKVKRH